MKRKVYSEEGQEGIFIMKSVEMSIRNCYTNPMKLDDTRTKLSNTLRMRGLGEIERIKNKVRETIKRNGGRCLERNANWKGGIKKHYDGYMMIRYPLHPLNIQGYVFQHILVMENHLGRPLMREESIHHIDFDKTNNYIDNLHLFPNESEHQKYHQRVKRFVMEELNSGGFKWKFDVGSKVISR